MRSLLLSSPCRLRVSGVPFFLIQAGDSKAYALSGECSAWLPLSAFVVGLSPPPCCAASKACWLQGLGLALECMQLYAAVTSMASSSCLSLRGPALPP